VVVPALIDSFLLVRLGSLGDIVHAIPVAAALRRQFPDARIDWVVSRKHKELLDLVPVLDRVIPVDGMWHALRELRRSRHEVSIDLQGLLKSAVLARSGARRSIGFSRRYLREPLARAFYTDGYDPGCGGIDDPRDTRHVVEINLGLLEPLGVTAGPAEFPIARVDSEAARAVAGLTGGRYVLLNPGAGWPNKRWPASRLGLVAAALRDQCGLVSVVLWGGGERPLAEEVAAHSGGAAIVSPPSSIADLVGLARGASLIVSGDTGPMHIAAAVGTPVVGVFGPTRPARNGPWLAADVTVSRAEVCRCYRLRRCTMGTMCLLDISTKEVIDAAVRRLEASPRHA